MSGWQWRIVITYLTGAFLGALDQNILGPALTTIVRDFNIAPKWGVWAVTVYTLVYAVAMPITAKIADKYGRRRVFQMGMALFAAGSLICALAGNFYVLLLGRAVQALGGGGILPIAVAEIGLAFPKEQRGKALGLYGATWGISSIVGPILGGIIVQYATWNWLFLINVIPALVVIALAVGLPMEQEREEKKMDWRGSLLVGSIILSLMLALTQARGHLGVDAFFSADVLGFLFIAVTLLPLFLRVERKAEDPVIDLSYFRNRRLVTVFITAALTGMIMMAVLFLPAYVEYVLGYPPGKASYMVALLALASVITSPLGGAMADRFGAVRVILLGLTASFFGSTLLTLLVEHTAGPGDVGMIGLATLVIGLLFLGSGMGLVMGSPLNLLVIEEVGAQAVSSGLAVMTVIRSFGNTLGPVAMGAMLTAAADWGAMRDGFAHIFVLQMIVAATGLVLVSTLLRRSGQSKG
ncbi:MFS transporter [Heliophilum fasciatum]|uniref:EmrB/QacA subfamily drug resistance transporter n=1 Tax=Heliophilum fasciatum TaxID=35700 RepID=A0A4R2RZ41_9FIRM|nr:MFS transporter [Heliophilum fasciatum]MCW2278005.1 EmrB/QacA subfamily drug resistance transporter [Heliophilum fasciatum]TCP64375.1 EmrB/QacA subfamily drug resistance transporter [Heliophilum fasciatum]